MDRRPQTVFFNGARELFSLTIRGLEKLKDKYIWTKKEVEEAHGYLILFRDTMKKENEELFHRIFGESGDFFDLEPFARGYSARVLSFKTIVDGSIKKWVIKVGFRFALIEYNGDPSTHNYAQEYQAYLDVLRKSVAHYHNLQYLLPEPQAILFAQFTETGQEKKQTTLAIQPCMQVVKPRQLRKVLTKQEKRQLLLELKSFRKLTDYLISRHEVRPELVGEGNLEIVRIQETYHLMLLDMGWVDLKKTLPITQTVAHISAQFVIGKLENWLKNRTNGEYKFGN